MRKNPDRYFFPAVFTYEDGQEIAVKFPDLDVATCGKDDTDALLSAVSCSASLCLGLRKTGRTFRHHPSSQLFPLHQTSVRH